jgi:hypothetical protein
MSGLSLERRESLRRALPPNHSHYAGVTLDTSRLTLNRWGLGYAMNWPFDHKGRKGHNALGSLHRANSQQGEDPQPR